MANEKDFTPQEWERIATAPFMAALAVTYSDLSSKKGIGDEARATGEAVMAGSLSSSEIVRAVAAGFAAGQKPSMPAIPDKPGEARHALIEGCKSASAIVAAKAPGEANAFGRFLLDVARSSAGASREGGFLGVGFVKVSEGEQLALANLALALGLPDQVAT